MGTVHITVELWFIASHVAGLIFLSVSEKTVEAFAYKKQERF